jgi:hypothetical protein
MRDVIRNHDIDKPAHRLLDVWTFFLGCVFLMAGMAHSVIPWTLDQASAWGHGVNGLSELARLWPRGLYVDLSVVSLSAMLTAVHALATFRSSHRPH